MFHIFLDHVFLVRSRVKIEITRPPKISKENGSELLVKLIAFNEYDKNLAKRLRSEMQQ